MSLPDDLPRKPFKSAAAFEKWLAAKHGSSPGLWLQVAKKASGIPTVLYEEAVEIALCYGWIDGQRRSMDEDYFLQRFTPRRARSVWSKTNVERVAKLIEAGRMQPAGMREVELAQADGRWEQAYEGASNMQVPDELAAVLRKRPKARKAFEGVSRTNYYAICWRVQTAKRPETRVRRAEQLADMLERGEFPHPQSQR